ncbi:Uncharacterised protein [Mycobacteroides abscessus subsp. abscessus]|nr:Uncharacterised protein [Mycobacteroides abscessus subsp. abscessus]
MNRAKCRSKAVNASALDKLVTFFSISIDDAVSYYIVFLPADSSKLGFNRNTF